MTDLNIPGANISTAGKIETEKIKQFDLTIRKVAEKKTDSYRRLKKLIQ